MININIHIKTTQKEVYDLYYCVEPKVAFEIYCKITS